ncbi:YHYH protein [Thalassomonas viridans]|uniref:YHYH protein n=1 Tax=Thalassomonas viridans TaxID=137584 RepID=A0AAE9Z411_9GAMM|nr:YHYH protein [Thalassomonas viridans]WDE05659.1 YHYH protein [Thalassomonas viridans]
MCNRLKLLYVFLLISGLGACGGGSGSGSTEQAIPDTEVTSPEEDPVEFALTGTEITDRGELPVAYTCDGSSLSPALSWQGAPQETTNFTVVMQHQSSDGIRHWYWLAYDIPADINSLAPGEIIGTLGANSINGLNEYAPPCSQGPGEKIYTITLYALSQSAEFGDAATVDGETLLSAIENITLASTDLTLSYERTSATGETSRCEQIGLSVSQAGFNEVSVSCDDDYAYITSDTYPDHDLMNGITGTNEQIPVPAVNYAAPVKLAPVLTYNLTTIDAAVGVAVNGVPIYDYSAQGELDIYNYDAADDTLALGQLDNCGGHAGRGDDYHYHASPNCMIASMANRGDDAIIGWGYDGFPLYGDNNPDGSAITDGALDVCNGQEDETFGYRYHTSQTPPYIIQCLSGEVDTNILPRVSPLSGDSTGARANLTPPQGGVENLSHVINEDGSRTMSYDYQGEAYYVTYSPLTDQENCYHFEQKTVSNGGIVETGTFCR